MGSFLYYLVRFCGFVIRSLPAAVALGVGRFLGTLAYYFDVKHRTLVYTNLKIAFAQTRTPHQLRMISKKCFQSFGQNVIELLRLPLLNTRLFNEYVKIEGKEHVDQAVAQGKGVILLAMHSGSWELASLSSAMLGHPYKVIVKPQTRFKRLGELLNSYRECNGSVLVERGLGMRAFIQGLKNNEVIGMVVDQGGKDGELVPLFNRQASMSVGAIRTALKMGVPVCFAVIVREKGPRHRLIIEPPMQIEQSGNMDKDVLVNLAKVAQRMEHYIREYPHEYMWFYKIWKYSKEAVAVILDDGRTGHLRQSQCVARQLVIALKEQGMTPVIRTVEVVFKSQFLARMFGVVSVLAKDAFCQGRTGFLRWFLTDESVRAIHSVKADFIISCGSMTAGVNNLLSNDQQAKSIAILKPGLLSMKRFDWVILPQHDMKKNKAIPPNVFVTKGAPNLITDEYLEEQRQGLLKRFSHMRIRDKFTIGVLLGGDTKTFPLSEKRVKMVVHQLKEVAQEISADILVSTSRRTSTKLDKMLLRELKRHPSCRLLIIANQNNVPEAVGGILSLSDLVIVSGDSISMISEAATSGKKTVVFPIRDLLELSPEEVKHERFINRLNEQGYILSSDVKRIRQAIYDLAKNKIQLRRLDDSAAILKAIKKVI